MHKKQALSDFIPTHHILRTIFDHLNPHPLSDESTSEYESAMPPLPRNNTSRGGPVNPPPSAPPQQANGHESSGAPTLPQGPANGQTAPHHGYVNNATNGTAMQNYGQGMSQLNYYYINYIPSVNDSLVMPINGQVAPHYGYGNNAIDVLPVQTNGYHIPQQNNYVDPDPSDVHVPERPANGYGNNAMNGMPVQTNGYHIPQQNNYVDPNPPNNNVPEGFERQETVGGESSHDMILRAATLAAQQVVKPAPTRSNPNETNGQARVPPSEPRDQTAAAPLSHGGTQNRTLLNGSTHQAGNPVQKDQRQLLSSLPSGWRTSGKSTADRRSNGQADNHSSSSSSYIPVPTSSSSPRPTPNGYQGSRGGLVNGASARPRADRQPTPNGYQGSQGGLVNGRSASSTNSPGINGNQVSHGGLVNGDWASTTDHQLPPKGKQGSQRGFVNGAPAPPTNGSGINRTPNGQARRSRIYDRSSQETEVDEDIPKRKHPREQRSSNRRPPPKPTGAVNNNTNLTSLPPRSGNPPPLGRFSPPPAYSPTVPNVRASPFTLQHRQLTRGTINPTHDNPYLRGIKADAPVLDESDFPSTRCHHGPPDIAPGDRDRADAPHGGAALPCANTAAHPSPDDTYRYVCVACRIAAHVHITASRPNLQRKIFWPLCPTCGDKALRDPAMKWDCSCGSQWLCPLCYESAMEDAQVVTSAEFEVRFDLFGRVTACKCGEPLRRGQVMVGQCAACLGIARGEWGSRQEEEVRMWAFDWRAGGGL